ncbi:neurturin [Denticeps clupeoides]|uniref:TGF-beta family profile domain-containing protein n=1 Tax=Denticeps clupeoides TaxID=299321 RepID=A0AAY4D0D0_9TELE|nr:neurturin-like [Denticeps clupeoides]
MKLWKCVAIVLMLCGAALTVFLTRTAPTGESSSPSSHSALYGSSKSSPVTGRRRPRAVEGMDAVLSEFMQMFKSFTEGELKQVIAALVEREKASEGRRTKRAQKGPKHCSLRKIELTVTNLGLGYVSDETIFFTYCSGRCRESRSNYDLALERILSRKKRRCCRPTSYSDILFLGNNFKYQTIYNLTADKCGCL